MVYINTYKSSILLGYNIVGAIIKPKNISKCRIQNKSWYSSNIRCALSLKQE